MLLLNHLEYNIVILIIIYLKLQTVPLSQSIDHNHKCNNHKFFNNFLYCIEGKKKRRQKIIYYVTH